LLDSEGDESFIEWYKAAAAQGYCVGEFNLGYCMGNGIGIERNEEEAMRWYKRAADQDFARAQYFLGEMYEFGDGVEVNWNESIRLYRMGANKKSEASFFNLGLCYKNGTGIECDRKMAACMFKFSGLLGYIPSKKEFYELNFSKVNLRF
jgi:TPR repeat protein